MRVAPRYALLPLLLLSAVSGPTASTPDDPLSMIVEARESLDRGDHVRAAKLAERVGALIAADAGWDPDGSIGERILPALLGRIGRMRQATTSLDRMAQPRGGKPGGAIPAEDPAELLRLLRRTAEESAHLKAQIERIVETIPRGPERGGLLQSESYDRAAGSAEPPGFAKMEGAVRSFLMAALDEGDAVRALRARLDTLKRELIGLSIEGEKLRTRLDATRRRNDADQARIIEFLGQKPSRVSAAESAGLNELGVALADRLRDRLEGIRTLTGQGLLQKALSMEELERFRLANAISVAAGSRDLSRRIDVLAAAIESVPVIDEGSIGASTGWLSCCMSLCWR